MISRLPQPKGALTVTIWRRGRAERRFRGPNAIVNGMFTTLAALIAGDRSAPVKGALGVGMNAPMASDTGLTQAILLPVAARAEGVAGHFSFTMALEQGNGQEISEYGLFYGDVLIARTVRAPILKQADIALACDWQIDFSGGV